MTSIHLHRNLGYIHKIVLPEELHLCKGVACAGVGQLQGESGQQPWVHMRPVAAAAQPGRARHTRSHRGRLLDDICEVRALNPKSQRVTREAP